MPVLKEKKDEFTEIRDWAFSETSDKFGLKPEFRSIFNDLKENPEGVKKE